jgi:hypothetical protein
VKPNMQANTSHVIDSKHIINPGPTRCNIDLGNFTDLAHKGRPIRDWLPNYKCRQSESIPFYYIHQGSVMNAGNIFANLILTMEVAYTC